ncbi:MAG: ankyrin repeat domain-containing protein [Omnitrophica WOR_2 bacterium]
MTTLSQEIIDQFVGAAHGDMDTVRHLLSQNPDLVNASASWKETAVEAAAQTGRKDIVEYLVSNGAPVGICTAAMLGRHEEVQAILREDPAQIHARGAHGIPLLYFPVIMGDKDLADFLLPLGINVNGGDGMTTPLQGAVLFNRPEMVEWLLLHGADIALKNYEGKTALQIAQEAGNTQIVALLQAKSGGG